MSCRKFTIEGFSDSIMTIDVQLAGPEHLAAFDRVADGVFAGPILGEQLAAFLADPRHLAAIASEADGVAPRVVGMASGVTCFHPDKRPQLMIRAVRVAVGRDRSAIARAVLRALLDEGRRLGCAEALITAPWPDRPGRALYASLGGAETAAGAQIRFGLTRRAGLRDSFDDR